jgi:hypothetical protein
VPWTVEVGLAEPCASVRMQRNSSLEPVDGAHLQLRGVDVGASWRWRPIKPLFSD